MPHDQPVVSISAADGHRFDLIHVPADEPTAGLFFIPGMGLSARQYIPLGLALAMQGVECWIHEWRGIGSSSVRASRRENWGYHELLDLDLAAAIEAIRSEMDECPLFIGGHSLGSQFALMLAGRQDQQPDGVVVVAGGSPYWRLYPPMHRSFLLPIFHSLHWLGSIFGHYPGRQVGFAGKEARNVMRDWTWTGRHGHYSLPSLDVDPTPGMAALTTPVLGVRMKDDWFVPERSLEGLLAQAPRCPTDQVVIEALPENAPTDHFAWTRQPAPVAEALANFIRDRASGQSD
ncbi:MAG: alpha/beta fold hydrolase [Pseudomonadota bacterium]